MDSIGRSHMGNFLLVVFFVTIFLSFILFLFYLRCTIRNYVLKRKFPSSSSSSSGSELLEIPHSRITKYSIDTECETETAILMIPQNDLRISQFHFEDEGENEILEQLYEKLRGENRKGNFFRLPRDRKDSYLKFNSVDDDLDELSDFFQMQTRHTLPFPSLRRNRQELYRKCTWDKKSLVQITKGNNNAERKCKVFDPKEPLIQTNNHRFSFLTRDGSMSKEILI